MHYLPSTHKKCQLARKRWRGYKGQPWCVLRHEAIGSKIIWWEFYHYGKHSQRPFWWQMRVSRSRTGSGVQWPMQRQITVLLVGGRAGKATRKNIAPNQSCDTGTLHFWKNNLLARSFLSFNCSTHKLFCLLGLWNSAAAKAVKLSRKVASCKPWWVKLLPHWQSSHSMVCIIFEGWYESFKNIHLQCCIRLWNNKDCIFYTTRDVAKQKSCILFQCPGIIFFLFFYNIDSVFLWYFLLSSQVSTNYPT